MYVGLTQRLRGGYQLLRYHPLCDLTPARDYGMRTEGERGFCWWIPMRLHGKIAW